MNGECQVHALYKRNVTNKNEFQLSTQTKPILNKVNILVQNV